jgi:cell fate (sporulation/competence/biofilm development) regulator YmcA (YheA/YmcA/DUF963 family)
MNENPTDHDNLVTLIAEVKTLSRGQDEIKKSQNEFHAEMRDTLSKLQDQTGNRITEIEKRVNNLEITKTDFREKLQNNNGYLKWILILVGLETAVLIFHLTGYHI